MKPQGHPKIAFVGWNPFQFLHFDRIAARFDNPVFIIEERKASRDVFDLRNLPAKAADVRHLDRSRMRRLDGEFDVLVCQTPFAGIEVIRNSRIAMYQYGYAKEAHNFAPWRSFADVCMTFGDYASRKIEPFCPCTATGNARYDHWLDATFHQAAVKEYSRGLDPARKTILYAPTWGDLSSFNHYSDAILRLADDHNVIFKIHHNSQLAGRDFTNSIRGKFATVCDTRDDIVELLAVSDLMISDYSGAIFDAVHCRVPVVLLNHSDSATHAGSKSDIHSIEQSGRARIGREVDSPSALATTVESALSAADDWLASLEPLRSELFIETTDAASHAADVITALARGEYAQNQSQQYIRDEMRKYYRCRSELSAARTFGGFLKMVANQVRGKFT